MSLTISKNSTWRVFQALAGRESGRSCRCCGEAILSVDPFGRSEGVCRPCRGVSS
jgi:hypothetical protein